MIRLLIIFSFFLSSCFLFDTEEDVQLKYDKLPVNHTRAEYDLLLDDKATLFIRLKTDSVPLDSILVDSVLVDGVLVDSVFVNGEFVDSVFVDSILVNGVLVDTIMVDSMWVGGHYSDSADIDSFEVIALPAQNFSARLDNAKNLLSQCPSWQFDSSTVAKYLVEIDELKLIFSTAIIGTHIHLDNYNSFSKIALAENYCKNSTSVLNEVYNLFLDEYLYQEELGPIGDYSSIQSLMDIDSSHGRHSRYSKPSANLTGQQSQWLAPVSNGVIGIEYYNRIDSVLVGDSIVYTDTLVISVVYPVSPANDAGIRSGDRIIKAKNIEVVNTGGNFKLFQELTAGEAGTVLKLELLRGSETIIATVTKGNIHAPTVLVDSTNGLGVIQVRRFSSDNSTYANGTSGEFRDALLQTAHFPHTIVDLRSNGGGVVSQCTKMADELIASGVLYQTAFMQEGKKYFTSKKAQIPGYGENRPFYFLVNGGSASCTEIFLIAIKENRTDLIIGDTTYGKGIGQGVFLLQEGLAGTVKVTSSEYFGKSGAGYHLVGIAPDRLLQPGEDALAVAVNTFLGTASAHIATKRSLVNGVELKRFTESIQENPLPWMPLLIEDY